MSHAPNSANELIVEAPASGTYAIDQSEFRDQVRSGLRWSFINTLAGRLISFVSGIILARLLVPSQYGVYAVGLTALAALLTMNDLGSSVAIIQWPGEVRKIAPTVVSIALSSSIFFGSICWLSAPWIASAMHNRAATPIIQALSVCLLIDGVTAVPAGIMTRKFMQRRRMVIDTTCLIASSAVTIGLAAKGFGAMSLAVGLIVGNAVGALMYVLWVDERFWPGFDRTYAKALLHFGLPLSAAGGLTLVLLNVDYFVISVTLDSQHLGLYMIAFNLSNWPMIILSGPVKRVALAGFARLNTGDRAQLHRAFGQVLVLLLTASAPACILLSTLAHPLVEFVYTSKFAPGAVALPGLAILTIVRISTDLGYDLIVSQGKSKLPMALQGFWLVLLVPTLAIAARIGGIAGVGWGHAALAVLIIAPTYAYVLGRMGVRIGFVLPLLVRPVLGSLALAAISLGSNYLLPNDFARLACGGIVGLAVYVAIIWPLRSLRHFS